MSGSYRIDLPGEGDKLQIHLQGVRISRDENDIGSVEELDPLNMLVFELDLGEALKRYINNDDHLYLNAFISVKEKPNMVEVRCPVCERIVMQDSNLKRNCYHICDCDNSFNNLGELNVS